MQALDHIYGICTDMQIDVYPRIALTESETKQKFQIICISQCTLNKKLSKTIYVIILNVTQ